MLRFANTETTNIVDLATWYVKIYNPCILSTAKILISSDLNKICLDETSHQDKITIMPHKNKKLQEKTYEISDIDERLVAMKCQHIYTHGHGAGCDNCQYIPYEDHPVENYSSSNHIMDMFNDPNLIDLINSMQQQNIINKTTYEQLKKKSPSLQRDKILHDLKERFDKGKLSEKKYTQLVLATYMQY